jgi:hypothetical protein
MKDLDKPGHRRPWEPPALKSVGTISQLVRTGGGKVSAVSGDSGDPPFKPPGHE